MDNSGVIVVGLAGQSAFLYTSHFPLPGETVPCGDLFYEPGGKGYNQSVASARMQVPTVFLGAVGNDAWADVCECALRDEGISTCLIKKEAPSAFAVITRIPGGENTVQVFSGAAKQLTPNDLRAELIPKILEGKGLLLLQNELDLATLTEACIIAKEYGLKVILNPAPAGMIPSNVLDTCTLITPNYGEACALVGLTESDGVDYWLLAKAFQNKHLPDAIITLGGDGCMLVTEDEVKMISAYVAGETIDTTGAGDTFNGVLAAMISKGMDVEIAARYASVAAGISVTRRGAVACIPYYEEVQKCLQGSCSN